MVERSFGSQHRATVPDVPGFERGTADAGDVACSHALSGKTRDAYQAEYGNVMTRTANGSYFPATAIDAQSLIIPGRC